MMPEEASAPSARPLPGSNPSSPSGSSPLHTWLDGQLSTSGPAPSSSTPTGCARRAERGSNPDAPPTESTAMQRPALGQDRSVAPPLIARLVSLVKPGLSGSNDSTAGPDTFDVHRCVDGHATCPSRNGASALLTTATGLSAAIETGSKVTSSVSPTTVHCRAVAHAIPLGLNGSDTGAAVAVRDGSYVSTAPP